MPGQPNRKSPDELERARPLPGHGGTGNHSIEHAWAPTDDALVLADRLRRKSMQVEKLKRDKVELRQALSLKTEEAYQEGLLAAAPTLLAIDRKIADIVDRLVSSDVGEDELRLLKALLPELSKMRDRLYGKSRQRVQSSSVSASVDIGELMARARGGGEVLDAVDAEVIDE